jgi:hypothetical protein
MVYVWSEGPSARHMVPGPSVLAPLEAQCDRLRPLPTVKNYRLGRENFVGQRKGPKNFLRRAYMSAGHVQADHCCDLPDVSPLQDGASPGYSGAVCGPIWRTVGSGTGKGAWGASAFANDGNGPGGSASTNMSGRLAYTAGFKACKCPPSDRACAVRDAGLRFRDQSLPAVTHNQGFGPSEIPGLGIASLASRRPSRFAYVPAALPRLIA